MKHSEAASADELLEKMPRVRPHATQAEVEKLLGRPDWVLTPGYLPPWVKKSALGGVTDGVVLVYGTKRYWKDLIIHVLPESGVQFVTWGD